jgi:hypothetical protein
MTGLSDKSGGIAHGLNAYIDRTDGSTADSLGKAMTEVAEWIRSSAGCFLGHVKMAVTTGTGTVTLNLTDLGTGVEHHGSIPDGVRADIRFMAAVLDADRNELAERMNNALLSNGFKMKKSGIIELR